MDDGYDGKISNMEYSGKRRRRRRDETTIFLTTRQGDKINISLQNPKSTK